MAAGAMSDLPVKINDLVQVRILGTEPSSTYPARVDDIAKGLLILSWPTYAGATIPLHSKQPLSLYFIKEDAVYNFEGEIEETQQEPIPRISVRPTGQTQRIQRRAFFRVRAMLPVQLTGILEPGSAKGGEKENILHIVTSTVDISGAGLAIHHHAPIPTDAMFDIKLTVEKDEPPLKLLGRVVHSEPIIGLADRRLYHVAFFFVLIKEAQRRAIVRRCFRIQQEALTIDPARADQ
jgi:c-di-GMP-binding flagellar brake protein YcgR